MPVKIVAIINNKGGVGKSTATQNLAHAVSNLERVSKKQRQKNRVLVIDMDPQANTTSVFLPEEEPQKTIYNLFKDDAPVKDCIYGTPYEAVDILPNSPGVAMLEPDFYLDVASAYHLLRDSVRDYIIEHYDYVFIDCPPTLGMWTIMSLIAADGVLIPIEAGSRYSLDGFASTIEAIEVIATRSNKQLRFLKAIINKVDLRTSVKRASVENIRRVFVDRVFETTIPENTDIQQSELAKRTVIRHKPQSSSAKKFRDLAEEFIALAEKLG